MQNAIYEFEFMTLEYQENEKLNRANGWTVSN